MLSPDRAASPAPGRDAAAERRPSVARLAASLRDRVSASGKAEALILCDALAVLLGRHLRFDAADPSWADMDRLLLAQDAAPLGPAMTELLHAGPDLVHAPLQAIPMAVGVAQGERLMAARFGRSLVDHRCWVLGGGAELATGAVQEAASLAGQWRLGRLAVIAGVSSDEAPGLASFAVHGWAVRRCPTGDIPGIIAALSAAQRSFKPTLIACVGPPASAAQGAIGFEPDEDVEGTWEAAWAIAARRGASVRRSWLKRLTRHASRRDFEHAAAGRLTPGWHVPLADPARLHAEGGQVSTAQAVRRACADLPRVLPGWAMLPGAAGWTGSENAPQPDRLSQAPLTQAVSAALAGLALHGGVVPVAAHDLCELDRLRPALGEAAREGLRMVELLVEPEVTHPCPGYLASLRAMGRVTVFRPADASEALECLELALRHVAGPSVLLVSEQPVPLLADRPARTRAARGGYLVAGPAGFRRERDGVLAADRAADGAPDGAPDGARHATLLASGPDLHVALAARQALAAAGLAVAVVSLPCWSLFASQDPAWRAGVLGTAPRIGIEASGGFGWERWLGDTGLFVSLAPQAAPKTGCLGGLCAEAASRRVADAVLRHLGPLAS